jgi:hypothetical protein
MAIGHRFVHAYAVAANVSKRIERIESALKAARALALETISIGAIFNVVARKPTHATVVFPHRVLWSVALGREEGTRYQCTFVCTSTQLFSQHCSPSGHCLVPLPPKECRAGENLVLFLCQRKRKTMRCKCYQFLGSPHEYRFKH